MRIVIVAGLLTCVLFMGCAGDTGTLGGRQKCWNQSDNRLASLMKGTLNLDPARPTLDTPEGDVLTLYFSGVRPSGASSDALVDSGGATVAHAGDLVTLFGGLGADRSMVVCSVEKDQ